MRGGSTEPEGIENTEFLARSREAAKSGQGKNMSKVDSESEDFWHRFSIQLPGAPSSWFPFAALRLRVKPSRLPMRFEDNGG